MASSLSALLRSSRGYRLDANGISLGVVEDVLYGVGPEPAALVVRDGVVPRRTIIPVEDVLEVVAGTRRILVRGRAVLRRST